jgi:MoaA/NifB/PqqE/SkfB family radical SAM enzyme
MKEWTDQFNPFNSMKMFFHADRLKGCAEDNYRIPLTVNIDPTNKCNFNCCFCCSDYIVKNSQETMTHEHMIEIADFLHNWGDGSEDGVKSVYISGGGEPLMNPHTPKLIHRLYENNIESAVITNGTFLNDENMHIILKCCRWIGISVDAICNETYNKMKGLPATSKLFDRVIDNIQKLVAIKNATNSKCDIGFKFLMHPNNFKEVYFSAELAKALKVNDYHLRPVRYINFDKIDSSSINFKDNLQFINEQFEAVQSLNSDTFHVYGMRHKFNPDFSIKKNFHRCWAIPMEPTFSSDGRVHICFDQRGREDLILCNHYPNVREILSVWNTPKHVEMIRKININTCPACTFSSYNEGIEKAVINDNMCRNFL